MAPHDLRRPFKRAAISDQQRRKELSLQRQAQHRRDGQHQACCLASFLNLHSDPDPEPVPEPSDSPKKLDIRHASKLKGAEARKWFICQLTLPEWMIDVPDQLPQTGMCLRGQQGCDALWTIFLLHYLVELGLKIPQALRSHILYLTAIFHELDQTYYVIDKVCWREDSLYDCKAEFRFLWLSSKLAETSACVV